MEKKSKIKTNKKLLSPIALKTQKRTHAQFFSLVKGRNMGPIIRYNISRNLSSGKRRKNYSHEKFELKFLLRCLAIFHSKDEPKK